jgi:peptidoglycan/LPS O-acetylase OafA/YrhL
LIAGHGRVHFLDGARGWAAVAVAYGHIELWLRPAAQSSGYGFFHDLIYTSPLGLAAEVAVTLFFVISGFALSYPVLVSQDPRRTLSNMALYRYFRLAVPVLASCMFAYALWRAGAFFNADAGQVSGSAWFAKFYHFDENAPSVVRFSLLDVYLGGIAARESWNPVLWTMSIEIVGSFGLFALLAAFRSTRIRVALALATAGVLVASAHVGLGAYAGNYFGFPAGYLLAEFAVSASAGSKLRRAAPALLLGALAFGIFSISPLLARNVSHAIDAQFAMNLCAFVLIAGILLSPRAQALLSTPTARFLGQISFSLYLTHFLVLSSLDAGVYLFARGRGWGDGMAVLLVLVATTAAYFAIARIFNLVVEEYLLSAIKRRLLATATRIWRPAARPQEARVPVAVVSRGEGRMAGS